jgi:cell division septum initiation protein DivIVA
MTTQTKTLPPPQPPLVPSSPPRFATVARGLHPDQVHEYISGLLADLGQMRHMLAEAGAGVLHAAESPQGQRAIVDLMRVAVDEIERNQAAADADIAQMIADATAQAAQVKDQAARESRSMVAGAREQADTVLATARADAKAMTDKAAAESAAVHEGAERRLEGLLTLHAQTLSRMMEIRDVMSRSLDAEGERGTLDEEVERALAGTAAVAASTPARLTALPSGQ